MASFSGQSTWADEEDVLGKHDPEESEVFAQEEGIVDTLYDPTDFKSVPVTVSTKNESNSSDEDSDEDDEEEDEEVVASVPEAEGDGKNPREKKAKKGGPVQLSKEEKEALKKKEMQELDELLSNFGIDPASAKEGASKANAQPVETNVVSSEDNKTKKKKKKKSKAASKPEKAPIENVKDSSTSVIVDIKSVMKVRLTPFVLNSRTPSFFSCVVMHIGDSNVFDYKYFSNTGACQRRNCPCSSAHTLHASMLPFEPA